MITNGSDICLNIDNMLQTEITHRGPVSPYGDIDLGDVGSSNGLVPDATKPFSAEQFHKKCSWT